jgi:hypothetical protein
LRSSTSFTLAVDGGERGLRVTVSKEFNERGIPTVNGQSAWQAVQVQRLLDRLG